MLSASTGRLLIATLLVSSSIISQEILAQTAPQNFAIDEYGFDLLHWTVFDPGTDDVSIGNGANGLSYSREGLVSGYDIGSYFVISDYPNSGDKIANLGSKSVRFVFSFVNGVPTFTDQSGSGYLFSSIYGGELVVAPDGTRFEFSHWSGTPDQNDEIAYLTRMTRSDGRNIKVNWSQYAYNWWNGETTNYEFFDRIQSVENSFGYMLKLDYQSDVEPLSDPNWLNLSSVTAINKTVEYCDPYADDCAVSPTAWPKATYSRPNANTLVVGSPGGRTRTYASTYNGQSGSYTVSGDGAENVQMTWSGYSRTVSKLGASATYNISGNVVSRTESTGGVTVYTLGPVNGVFSRVESIKDPLNRTTTYQYDASNRVTRVTRPEGNYTQYTYDARGNIIETRQVSKTPGTPPDIVYTSGFDVSCANSVKCNKPNWTKDARGNQTDYTYDAAHGGTLIVTSPAAAAGQPRPQTRNSYTQIQAYFKNASGQIIASGEPVYMLTGTSACQTSASCSGVLDEVKTTIDYGPQVAGTANNLLPVSVSKGAGNGSLTATVAFTYDNIGNRLTVDGPLAGTADTTRTRYDPARQVIGIVGPDPDGAGALKHRAQRLTYNVDGQVTNIEIGNVNSQSDADWAAIAVAQNVAITYDANARPVKQELKSGATTYALSQTSYDTLGRVDCQATRMDPAQWGSQTNACTPQTTGPNGPDRITKTIYDAASEVTQVQTAVGTADASNEVTTTYNANGTMATVKDGENNLTTYEYDGFDRLVKTRYPSSTQGSGTSSTTDYEQLTLDANGNTTQRRLRDGQIQSFTFDNLNRVTLKDVPNIAYYENDISYTYDNLGRTLSAFKTGVISVSFAYDALGRQTSETSVFGTKTMQYDLAGRLTRLTWPDAFYATYDYDVTGNVTAIRENGAASGIGVLGTYSYDNLGRRTSLTRGNGTVTSYSYDPVSRLSSLTQDMVGTTSDLTINGFSYNPASQIGALTRSNDNYAWGGHYNVNRNYTVNGLNQMTAAGATSLGFDGRGNLTSSGSSTYQYTSDNVMATTGSGVYLANDPLGRIAQVYANGGALVTPMDYVGSKLISEMNGSNQLIRRYVYGPGEDEPLTWYEGSGTTDRRWLHADERGSVVAVTNASGTAIAINSYDEYGIPASANIGRFQYTGQAWLPELGMYYYKARMYSPTLGRFMQTDPIGYADGINWYNYVGSDPVNATDPSGLACVGFGCGSNEVLTAGGGTTISGLYSINPRDAFYYNRGGDCDRANVRAQGDNLDRCQAMAAQMMANRAGSAPGRGIGRDCSDFQRFAEEFADFGAKVSAVTFDAAVYGEVAGIALDKFGSGRAARFGRFIAGKAIAGKLLAASTISGTLSLIGYAASGQSVKAIYNKAINAAVDRTIGRFDGPLGKFVADRVTSGSQSSFDTQKCRK